MKLFSGDYISLHEHDDLYPPNYLQNIQSIISELPDSTFGYIAYNNIIGLNRSAYLE